MNAGIPLLWRCFHFHAYFSFPRETDRLDYSASKRAIGLLAAEGNLRLGDNADGITMDRDRYPDANARASKRLWILFKSLSTQKPLSADYGATTSSVLDLSTTEDDVMDVLALTQPDNPCIMPAPMEELRHYAKRILGSSEFHASYSIPQRDFLSLLNLMLSIQMDKPEWGSHQPYFNTGRILQRPPREFLRGAADAILRSFNHEVTEDIEWDDFHKVLRVYLVRSFKFDLRCLTANRINLRLAFFRNFASSSQPFYLHRPQQIEPPSHLQSPHSLSNTLNTSSSSYTHHQLTLHATSLKNLLVKKAITLFKPLNAYILLPLPLSTPQTSPPP